MKIKFLLDKLKKYKHNYIMKKICKDSVLNLEKNISWQNYFGVTYIIKEPNINIYTFDSMGSVIWQKLQLYTRYDKLLDFCLKEFKNYSYEEIDNLLQDFLNQLIKFKLIKVL